MIQFLFDCPHLRTEAMVIFNGNKRRKTRMLAFFKWNLEQSFFFSSTKPNQIDIDYAVNDSVSLSFFSFNLSFSPHVFIYVGAFIFINLHKEWIPRRIQCVLCVLFLRMIHTHTHSTTGCNMLAPLHLFIFFSVCMLSYQMVSVIACVCYVWHYTTIYGRLPLKSLKWH